MKNIYKIFLWLSVFFLAIETPFTTIAGQSLKFWMLSSLASGLILLWDILKNGLGQIKQSGILFLGSGFVVFSLLGLINSPRTGYSLKQIVVLISLVILAIFFEKYGRKKFKILYSALAGGIFLSVAAAIYQNVAFELGWPHFETMAARPNAFFPEADWLGMFLALGLAPFLVALVNNKNAKLPKILQNKYLLYVFSLLAVTVIIMTVARASWLALIAEMGIILLLTTYDLRLTTKNHSRQSSVVSRQSLKTAAIFISLIFISLAIINLFHLSRFNIPDRFRSIFFREHIITVAQNPATGENFKINLEEIEKYRAEGYLIKENYITDENVTSREEKVASTWDIIKNHPFFGSGLGVTLINTNYQHNANNLFLEWWASAGLGGILLITSFLVYLLVKGLGLVKKDLMSTQIILAGTAGFIIVNLFNASIFLAFAWFYLALLLLGKSKNKIENSK